MDKRQLELYTDYLISNYGYAMLEVCAANQLKFRDVLMDSWYAARENFEFIVKKGSILSRR